jgi:hypothetical protein
MEACDPSSEPREVARAAQGQASPSDTPSSWVRDAGHTGPRPSMTISQILSRGTWVEFSDLR